ncbi:MAG: hypothetical protein RR309_08360 [Cellulosilyticaceae bacterium]
MIKQSRDYIAKRKKHFLMMSGIWTLIIVGLFLFGIAITKDRGNMFTVLAAVMTLGLAQNITRLISFGRYKDPKEKHSKILDNMKGSLGIYHSAVIPDTTATVFFEHIVVTSRNIYFISKDKEMIEKTKGWLAGRLDNKGINSGNIHFIIATDSKGIKNASIKIEKDACYTSEGLDKHNKIIEAILM